MARGMRVLVAAAAACALASGVPSAGAETTTAPFSGASLSVVTGDIGGQSETFVDVALQTASEGGQPPGVAARVSVDVPAGFAIGTTPGPGRILGHLFATVASAADASSTTNLDADIVVDDPSVYASDPVAQACAPGSHAAEWRATFSLLGQQLPLPIAVDTVSGAAGAPPTYVLTFCPSRSPSPAFPSGVAFLDVTALVLGTVDVPSAPGAYVWSALVTPASQFVADATKTFELRALVPLPENLTLKAAYEPRKKTVRLSGRLTAAGAALAGAQVVIFAAGADATATPIARVQPRSDGTFALDRPIAETTQFDASVVATTATCTPPSAAPAGCTSETVTPPPDAIATAIVPRRTDPKLVAKAHDQALARQVILAALDFPASWQAVQDSPGPCAAFAPDLRRLTIGGQAFSPVYVSPDGNAAARSTATIFSSRADAVAAFAKVAVVAAARCEASDVTSDQSGAPRVTPLALPRVGDESRAFQGSVSTSSGVVDVDVVTIRVGRVLVEQDVYALGESELGLDLDLAQQGSRACPPRLTDVSVPTSADEDHVLAALERPSIEPAVALLHVEAGLVDHGQPFVEIEPVERHRRGRLAGADGERQPASPLVPVGPLEDARFALEPAPVGLLDVLPARRKDVEDEPSCRREHRMRGLERATLVARVGHVQQRPERADHEWNPFRNGGHPEVAEAKIDSVGDAALLGELSRDGKHPRGLVDPDHGHACLRDRYRDPPRPHR
jgi:hypothetical protein